MKWQARLVGVATINALGEAWGGKKSGGHTVHEGVPTMETLRTFGIGFNGNHTD